MTLRLNGEGEVRLWEAVYIAAVQRGASGVAAIRAETQGLGIGFPPLTTAAQEADAAVLALRDRVRVPDAERCTALGPESRSRCVYGDGHNGAHLFEGPA